MIEPRTRTVIPTRFEADTLSGKGKVRNVSPGGLFVGTRIIPEEGEIVQLRLNAPGSPEIEISGLVWWTTREQESPNGQSGFGLRILEECESYQHMISRLK